MPLPNVLELLHLVKHHTEPLPQAEVPNNMVNLDDYRKQHHQTLQQNLVAATGSPVAPGSTIPAIETSPAITAVPPSLLSVIQGASHENLMDTRQKEIDLTLDDSYKSPETGIGSTADRILLNKDGLTTPIDFLAEKKKREEDQAAVKEQVQQQVAEEKKLAT